MFFINVYSLCNCIKFWFSIIVLYGLINFKIDLIFRASSSGLACFVSVVFRWGRASAIPLNIALHFNNINTFTGLLRYWKFHKILIFIFGVFIKIDFDFLFIPYLIQKLFVALIPWQFLYKHAFMIYLALNYIKLYNIRVVRK